MKKIKLLIVFYLMMFICLPSNVTAGEKTTTYTQYYFFLESYRDNITNNGDNNITIGGGTNETAFNHLKIANKNVKVERICLSDSNFNNPYDDCVEDSNFPDYNSFYIKYFNLLNSHNKKKYIVDGVECETLTLTENATTSYYLHGCYKNTAEGIWHSNINNNISMSGSPSMYACASVDLPSKAENFEEKYKNTEGAYLDAKIIRDTREITPSNGCLSKSTEGNISSCNKTAVCTEDSSVYEYYSPILYKVTYEVTTYTCDPIITTGDPDCNDYITNQNICNKKTIKIDDSSRAEIEINQNYTIVNVLTPEEIYQGGGIKYGFIYYNTISWNFADSITKYGDIESIKKYISNKIQPVNEFEQNLKITNIKFGKEIINDNFMVKDCKRTGEFNEGETVTTICTIYLPDYIIDNYTGDVNYKPTAYGGINNKYYTPLSYVGGYQTYATIENLNVLKNDIEWDGNWNVTFNDEETCKINVYNKLYNKPQYIYRPIDLNNPFPSRNAGINWFDWYKEDGNKYDLEHSYSDLEYSFNLNNEKLSSIKKYNNQKDAEETGYFNWEDIEDGESSFVDEYAEKVGDNL